MIVFGQKELEAQCDKMRPYKKEKQMKKKLIMVCLLFIALISGCAKKDAAANVEDKPTIKLAVCSGAGLLHEDKIWEINEGDYPYSVEIVDYLEAADGDISLAVKNLNKELALAMAPI